MTDVLSFAWHPADAPIELWRGKMGEMYIAIHRLSARPRSMAWREEQEFKRMLVHGLLHLVGYDHIKKKTLLKCLSNRKN